MDAAALKEAKERLGLSTNELARALGAGDRTLRHWLAGTKPIDPAAACLLACLLEVPGTLAGLHDHYRGAPSSRARLRWLAARFPAAARLVEARGLASVIGASSSRAR